MLCDSTLDRLGGRDHHAAPDHLTHDQSRAPNREAAPALTKRDHALLRDWFDSGPDVRVIIDNADMTLHEFAAWSQQPHIARALADIRAMYEARTHDLALASADAAVNCLKVSTMIEDATPETKRKAAAQLFRAGVRLAPEERASLRRAPRARPRIDEAAPLTRPAHEPAISTHFTKTDDAQGSNRESRPHSLGDDPSRASEPSRSFIGAFPCAASPSP